MIYGTNLTTTPLAIEGNSAILRSHGLAEYHSAAEIACAMGINPGQLRFLTSSFPGSEVKHYVHFKISKKTGGERLISAPKPHLKAAQRWILENILEKLEVHHAAHGFCKNRSIVTNAQPHVGADVIVHIDLQNFFQSITYKRVKQLFSGCGYSGIAANIFALICTTSEIEIHEQAHNISLENRHLPQGSPTSPVISNLICYHLDRRMLTMAENLEFSYTRYADDLTFSASGQASERRYKLIKNAKLIINSEGFTVNSHKTNILGKSVQQQVTGVVVNTQLNISKKTLKAFRATLYQIEQEGLSGKHWGNSPNIIAAITGFANYVAMINPNKGAELRSRVERIKEKYESQE